MCVEKYKRVSQFPLTQVRIKHLRLIDILSPYVYITLVILLIISSANATPEFEGRGGEELGTELSNTLYKVFNNKHSVDLKSLCISAGEHCWVLYVDVLVSGPIMSFTFRNGNPTFMPTSCSN